VVDVDPYGGADVSTVLRRLDPGGGQAMPVASMPSTVFGATSADQETSSGPSRDRFTLLAVEQARLDRNSFWRSDFTSVGLGQLAGTVSGAVRRQMPFQGTRLRLHLSSSVACCGPIAVQADLVGPDQHSFVVQFGTVRAGDSRPAAATAQCAKVACTIRRLVFYRAAPGAYRIVMDVSLLGVDGRRASGWQPLPGASDPTLWTAYDDRDPAVLAEPVLRCGWTRGEPGSSSRVTGYCRC
jgi:hypothetical protein